MTDDEWLAMRTANRVWQARRKYEYGWQAGPEHAIPFGLVGDSALHHVVVWFSKSDGVAATYLDGALVARERRR